MRTNLTTTNGEPIFRSLEGRLHIWVKDCKCGHMHREYITERRLGRYE